MMRSASTKSHLDAAPTSATDFDDVAPPPAPRLRRTVSAGGSSGGGSYSGGEALGGWRGLVAPLLADGLTADLERAVAFVLEPASGGDGAADGVAEAVADEKMKTGGGGEDAVGRALVALTVVGGWQRSNGLRAGSRVVLASLPPPEKKDAPAPLPAGVGVGSWGSVRSVAPAEGAARVEFDGQSPSLSAAARGWPVPLACLDVASSPVDDPRAAAASTASSASSSIAVSAAAAASGASSSAYNDPCAASPAGAEGFCVESGGDGSNGGTYGGGGGGIDSLDWASALCDLQRRWPGILAALAAAVEALASAGAPPNAHATVAVAAPSSADDAAGAGAASYSLRPASKLRVRHPLGARLLQALASRALVALAAVQASDSATSSSYSLSASSSASSAPASSDATLAAALRAAVRPGHVGGSVSGSGSSSGGGGSGRASSLTASCASAELAQRIYEGLSSAQPVRSEAPSSHGESAAFALTSESKQNCGAGEASAFATTVFSAAPAAIAAAEAFAVTSGGGAPIPRSLVRLTFDPKITHRGSTTNITFRPATGSDLGLTLQVRAPPSPPTEHIFKKLNMMHNVLHHYVQVCCVMCLTVLVNAPLDAACLAL